MLRCCSDCKYFLKGPALFPHTSFNAFLWYCV